MNNTEFMINNWDLKSILAISQLPNLNSNAAIQKISDSTDYSHFSNFKDIYKVSNYFSDTKLIETSEKSIFEEAELIYDKCQSENIQIISYWDEQYPKLLKSIDFPPLILYIKGELQAADSAIISIVGTRHSTDYGKLCTEHFTEAFVNAGLVIASGMATGIDTIAHMEAIKHKGITYAVIASGIDKISPQSAQMNANKIIDSGGAIISTYKPGTNALPPYFLQRNRIISGIAKAVLVIESAFKGGSLNTARNASEQNREVYAIPGRINSERSKGTNNLIRKNIASIAISPEDILEDLRISVSDNIFEKNTSKVILTSTQEIILKYIDSEPINIDKIAELSGLEIPTLLNDLLLLEFSNLVKQIPGKNYIKFNV